MDNDPFRNIYKQEFRDKQTSFMKNSGFCWMRQTTRRLLTLLLLLIRYFFHCRIIYQRVGPIVINNALQEPRQIRMLESTLVGPNNRDKIIHVLVIML